MSITTYAELKTALTNWSKRSDLTSLLGDFISLAESDMQARCKLVDFEDIARVAFTDGFGTVPSVFSCARSAYWDGNLERPVKYIPPAQYDSLLNQSGETSYFTAIGGEILTIPKQTGNLVITYQSRFTPLSDVNTSNVLLSNYPDAYLHGSLAQLYLYCMDDQRAVIHGGLFDNAIGRIKKDNAERKYPGPLQVRVA
jgi:hypothetical protein